MSEYSEELAYIESLDKLDRSIYFVKQSCDSEVDQLSFMVDNRKDFGYSMADIRKQRERVQWEQARLKNLRQQQSDKLRDYLGN